MSDSFSRIYSTFNPIGCFGRDIPEQDGSDRQSIIRGCRVDQRLLPVREPDNSSRRVRWQSKIRQVRNSDICPRTSFVMGMPAALRPGWILGRSLLVAQKTYNSQFAGERSLTLALAFRVQVQLDDREVIVR